VNFAYKIIQNIDVWPYCAVGLVIITDTDGKVYNGVGTLISGNVVLTCAHHVYDTKTNTEPKSLKFVLGVEGVHYSSSYTVTKWFYPDEYRQIPYDNDAYDYAVLILDAEDLSDDYGYIGVHVDFSDTSKQL
jgi:V8-like Glu-specific endopeptidase